MQVHANAIQRFDAARAARAIPVLPDGTLDRGAHQGRLPLVAEFSVDEESRSWASSSLDVAVVSRPFSPPVPDPRSRVALTVALSQFSRLFHQERILVFARVPPMATDEIRRLHFNLSASVMGQYDVPACNCGTLRCDHIDPTVVVYCETGGSLAADALDVHHRARHRVFVLDYTIQDISGSICGGEWTWHLDGRGNINFASSRGATPYARPAPLYTQSGFFDGEDRVFRVETRNIFGDYSLHEVYADPFAVVPPAYVWGHGLATQASEYALPTVSGLSGTSLALSHLIIRRARIEVFGGILLYQEDGEGTAVAVPKALVGRAGTFLVGKPRTAETYASLCRLVAGDLRKARNLPEEVKPVVAVVVSLLAFTNNVEFEALALHTIVTRDRGLWDAHFRILKFDLPWAFPARFAYASGGFATAAIVAKAYEQWWRAPAPHYPVARVVDVSLDADLTPYLRDGVLTDDALRLVQGCSSAALAVCGGYLTYRLVRAAPRGVVGAAVVGFVSYGVWSMAAGMRRINHHGLVWQGRDPPYFDVALPRERQYQVGVPGVLAAAAALTGAAGLVYHTMRRDGYQPAVAPPGPAPSHFDDGLETHPIDPGAYHVPLVRYGATEQGYQPKQPSDDTNVEMPEFDGPLKREPVAAQTNPGITFYGLTPTYHNSTAESEYAAISGRLALPGLPVDEEELDRAWELYYASPVGRRWAMDREPFRMNVHAFNVWARKFGRKRWDNLRKTYDEVRARGYLTKGDFKASGFVKRTKEYKLGDPRWITTFEDAIHVIGGPAIEHEYKQWLSSHFPPDAEDEADYHIMTGRKTAEQVGAWAHRWQRHLSRPGRPAILLESDLSRMDGHMRKPHIKRLNKRAITAPEDLVRQATHHLSDVSGRSRNGVRFRVKARMGSGSDETSYYDSVQSAVNTNYAVEPAEIGVEYVAAIQGDDVFVIISWDSATAICHLPDNAIAETVCAALCDLWTERHEVLGFDAKAKASIDICDVTFCSKAFYPVNNGETYVMGPLIGRALSRGGWYIDWDNDSTQTFRSAMVGLRNDSHHVPFLREYFDKCVALATGPMKGTPPWGMHVARVHEYDEETMDFVFRRYGLDHHDLQEFTAHLATVTALPAALEWEPVIAAAKRDA